MSKALKNKVKLNDVVSVKDFGAVGDWNGTTGTDDTAALQLAFNAGVPVFIPAGCYPKVTGPLTATAPIYMEGDTYIHPTGSGYTVLTITPAAGSGVWRVRVGDGNGPFTGNGIIFGNPATVGHTQISIDLLSARKCSGIGVQVNNLWESTVTKLETYGCGNPTNYAMEIRSNVGDSSNISSIQSVVVGQSDTLAFLGQIQHSRIAHLHVEETFTPATKFFWLNKCVGASYGKVRVYNAGSAQAWVGSTVQDFDQLDGDCTLVIDNTDSFGNEHVEIGNIYWLGGIVENSPSSSAAASCLVSVATGRITTLTTGTSGSFQLGARWDVQNCDITTLNIGRNAIGRYTRRSMEAVKFDNCAIGTLAVTQAADCSFSLVNGSTVAAFSGTLTGSLLLQRASIASAFAIQGETTSGVNWYSKLYAYECRFESTFDSTGNVVGEVVSSTIDGNMTRSTPATTNCGLVFIGSGCNGTVAAAYNATPMASDTLNQFGKGKRIDNIASAVGSPKGWICTVAGNPGTWVSEGNL